MVGLTRILSVSKKKLHVILRYEIMRLTRKKKKIKLAGTTFLVFL